ncbi:MAG: hypothetical protein U0610_26855 [bacterium]
MPDHEPRPSLFRKLVFTALTSTLAGAALVIAIRLHFTLAAQVVPDDPIPGPGALLRVHCTAFGAADCGRLWNAPLDRCLVPGCQTAQGFTTTPQGFLGPIDRVYATPKPPDTYRLLVLGGSTSGGWIWHLRWPAKLERLLGEAAARHGKRTRFEVLNAAFQGGTSEDSRKFFEWRAGALELDGVILGEEVNDVVSCDVFQDSQSPVDGQGGDDVVRAYLDGERSLDDVTALSPWHARHRAELAAEREHHRRQRLIASAARVVRPAPDAWKQTPNWRAECTREHPTPRAPSPSMLDDFDLGWLHTRQRFDAILDLASARGIPLAVVTTVPHDFDHYRCPTSPCATLFSLDDWRAYIERVHNPAVRAYARERDLALTDLEQVIDDFAMGRNTVNASLDLVLGELAAQRGLTAARMEQQFARGEIGKHPLFEEWMHPTPEGHELVAAAYFAVLWPRLAALP